MMDSKHADQYLIDAHEKRMESLEGWCSKLEGYVMKHGEDLKRMAKDTSDELKRTADNATAELKLKASTATVRWGVVIMITVLGSLLAVIWGTVIENGKLLHSVQRTQDLVVRELGINRPDR